MSLAEKKLAIIGEIGDVPKTGFNKNQNYPYHKEGDILGAIKPLLIQHRVVITPSLDWEHGPAVVKDGNLTTVYMKYTITDVETGEQEVIHWSSQGADNGDKGANKAFTASGKYALLKYFMMESDEEEDADAGNVSHSSASTQAARQTQAPPRNTAPAASKPPAQAPPPPQAPPQPAASALICEGENCGRTVPPGVANFSRNNFGGHIYCMDCQKKQTKQ